MYKVPALLAIPAHPLHRAGEHRQRDARRGDDDRRQQRHGRLRREDARPAARRALRRRRRVARPRRLPQPRREDGPDPRGRRRPTSRRWRRRWRSSPCYSSTSAASTITRQVQLIGVDPRSGAKTGDFAEFLFDDAGQAASPPSFAVPESRPAGTRPTGSRCSSRSSPRADDADAPRRSDAELAAAGARPRRDHRLRHWPRTTPGEQGRRPVHRPAGDEGRSSPSRPPARSPSRATTTSPSSTTSRAG